MNVQWREGDWDLYPNVDGNGYKDLLMIAAAEITSPWVDILEQ